MRVDGIDPRPVVAQGKKHVKQQEEPAVVENPPQDAVETAESEEQGRGVIRLLQEGHFKGVADVRLRINFFDELQAIESEGLKNEAGAGFEVFNQSIEGPLGVLEGSGELTEEQLAAIGTFLENIQGAQSTFLTSETLSVEDLIARLQAEFEELSGLFGPPEPQPAAEELPPPPEPDGPAEPAPAAPAAEEPAPAEPVEPEPTEPAPAEPTPAVPAPMEAAVEPEPQQDPPADSVFDLFTSLGESFQQALEQLQSALTGSQVLPSISEPSGNGKAYEKFIAIYEAMKNGEPAEPVIIDEVEAV